MINRKTIQALLTVPFISFSMAAWSEPVEITTQYATQALMEYSEQVEECARQRKVIPASTLRELNASEEELRLVLTYQAARSTLECSRSEMADLLLYTAVLQNIAPQMASELQEGMYLVTHDALTLLRREEEYKALSVSLRMAVESIPELQTPFDLAGTARALGL